MIAKNTDSFVFGEDSYPDWFIKLDKSGRVQFIRLTSSTFKLIIQNITGPVTAETGDTLMYISDSVIVVPRDAANKYMGGKQHV